MPEFRKALGRLPIRWRWTLHNVVGHPLSELIYQIGLKSLGHWVHDQTVPDPIGEDSRG